MSDDTSSTQPGTSGPVHGPPPVPPAQPYPGLPAQGQPSPSAQNQPAPLQSPPAQPPYAPPQPSTAPRTQVQPAHPPQAHPAQAPQGPYGYAPGHIGQSPYAPAGQAYPSQPYAVPARPTNGVAVAAMICGIVGILFSPGILAFLVPILIPIAAVVLGHIAMSQLKRSPGTGGKGMAVTGLILGYIPLAISLLGLLIIVIIALSIGAFSVPFIFAS